MPYGIDLDPGETITRVIHRSVFDLLPAVLASFALLAVAVFFAFLAGRSPEMMPFPQAVSLALVAVLTALSGLILVVGVFVSRSNVLVFTNIHYIQVERLALFQTRVSQLNFKRVEDVTGRRTGILQNIFDYGDVEVQSAGEQLKFRFKNAPHPRQIADQALQIHEQCLRESGEKEGS